MSRNVRNRNYAPPRKAYNLNAPFVKFTGISGAAFIGVLLIILPLFLILGNGFVMVMFGVVHSYWPAIPALGFWQTFGVFVLVQLLTAKSKSE